MVLFDSLNLSVPLCEVSKELFLETFLGHNQSLNGSFFDGGEDATDTEPVWIKMVMLCLCLMGLAGNLLNLIILTIKRTANSIGQLERSANLGLSALAFSDMMYCISVLPHTAIEILVDQNNAFTPYYQVYGSGIINFFLMTSTWLVVALAMGRYIVLFYPLKAKCILHSDREVWVICLVFLLTALLAAPFFLLSTVRKCVNFRSQYTYEIISPPSYSDRVAVALEMYVQWVWPSISVLLPLVLLFFCNVRLIQGLRTVYSERRLNCPGQIIKDNRRRTLTLVIIIMMVLILVTPAEVLRLVNPYATWGKAGDVIVAIANLLQTGNFAFNFILYCVIDPSFRQTCARVLCCKRGRECCRGEVLQRRSMQDINREMKISYYSSSFSSTHKMVTSHYIVNLDRI